MNIEVASNYEAADSKQQTAGTFGRFALPSSGCLFLECADLSALLGCDLSQPVVEWHSTEDDGDRSPMTKAVTGHRTQPQAEPLHN